MPDIPDRMRKKREWPDGVERICTGAIIVSSQSRGVLPIAVHEVPWEVNRLMQASESDAMLELHHHADAEVTVYVRNEEIISIDARWDRVEED